MSKEYSKESQWQSIFLVHVEAIPDKDLKILLLTNRVRSLESRNHKLKLKISGMKDPKREDILSHKEASFKNSAKNFYRSAAWRRIRFHVLSKDEPLCAVCGTRKNLQVDHKIPRSLRPDLALEESNLQILCEDCNMGKGTAVQRVIVRKKKQSATG